MIEGPDGILIEAEPGAPLGIVRLEGMLRTIRGAGAPS